MKESGVSERKRLTNKTILVTGASSGIGRACALALGREGAKVIAAGRRQERLEETAKAIRDSGSECEILTGDVRDQATCDDWVRESLARFGARLGGRDEQAEPGVLATTDTTTQLMQL